ncbi:hypothetical protein [Nocardia sp. NBC_01009]|nr:hypothetical protein OHA42_15840 [Nocardia sp. NBC_01009]
MRTPETAARPAPLTNAAPLAVRRSQPARLALSSIAAMTDP